MRIPGQIESDRSLLSTPGPHLAGVGAKLVIASPGTRGEPSVALGGRTAGDADETGNLLGESLPNGVGEPRGPAADGELRQPFVGRGDQLEPAAGQFFGYPPGQMFPRQAEQLASGRPSRTARLATCRR